MPRILIVEDDEHLRFGVGFNLEKEGHQVVSVESGEEGLAAFEGGTFDLVLADLMLPGISGFEVLEKIRQSDARIPVLILTARSDESDAVTALRLGADDYVRKPFGVSELIARIGAILRRVQGEPSSTASKQARLGDWTIDFKGQRAQGPSGVVSLTTMESELLRALLRRHGEVCRREDLLREVWGVDGPSLTRTLDNHMARLRKKLEQNPAEPRLLRTIHGAGYRVGDDGP